MREDPELNQWRAEWIAQPEPSRMNASGGRALAMRQQWRLRAAHVGELLTAVALLGFSLIFAWRNPAVETWLWAGVVWATTLAATAFSLWNWKILWNADVKSVSDYVQHYQERANAKLRAVSFGKALLAVQIAIAFPWFTWDFYSHNMTGEVYARSLVILAGMCLGFLAMFAHYRKSALRELEELRASHEMPAE